jgi:hypothetical protein
MSESTALPRFAVDFSEAALDGQVSVLLRDEIALSEGQHVELIDDDGNTAPGVVTGIEKHVAWVRPQLDRISLNPVDFQDALRAMLRTGPER